METTARPLYLDARERLFVRRLGPSLTVRDNTGRQQWYPLSRISRIISRGEVEWSPPALVGCLEHGIGILLLDRDARVVALCTPARSTPLSLDERLEAAMASPAWPERFENWRASQERRLMNHLCDALRRERADRPGELREAMLKLLRELQGVDAPDRIALLEGPLTAHLQEIMGAAGIGPVASCGWRGNITLIEELAALMWWPMIGRILQKKVPLPREGRGAWPYYEYFMSRKLAPTMRRLVAYLWKIPL